MKQPNISIIIPILNEAQHITQHLETLLDRMKYTYHEILLIDGGSTDATVEIITSFISKYHKQQFTGKKRCVDSLFETEKPTIQIQLFSSEKGRAKQMNLGAQKATKDVLYFLHADTFPPKYFDDHILQEITKGNKVGCFRMKFDYPHPVLLVSQFFTRFNVNWCRGGDQSLFIEKLLFESLGGFDESYIIYEDCEFINRLYEKENFTIIPKSVKTSARKYKVKGTWKLQYHFAMIHIKKSKGATPEELYAYYKKYVAS
ncbi:TIGR04283 family arsenosugar biosynthesis glycosyltransferase [uncultured Kordia sp.]|uniref:TIGR04283 family arsenosugar biosynthesis glycosyltransferase n=1 Tax=uncultured Kordia sp. TaxID=507699 RepID=UPI00261B3A76|nr:TIGR04283 family arsenosugar biosynthesis glycosyltransferase [uncultured Kordia sp.]